jgi:hypothetical protein
VQCDVLPSTDAHPQLQARRDGTADGCASYSLASLRAAGAPRCVENPNRGRACANSRIRDRSAARSFARLGRYHAARLNGADLAQGVRDLLFGKLRLPHRSHPLIGDREGVTFLYFRLPSFPGEASFGGAGGGDMRHRHYTSRSRLVCKTSRTHLTQNLSGCSAAAIWQPKHWDSFHQSTNVTHCCFAMTIEIETSLNQLQRCCAG